MDNNLQRKSDCRFLPYLFFLLSASAISLISFLIKNSEEKNLVTEKTTESESLDSQTGQIQQVQSTISADREGKLRDFNSKAKDIQQVQTTTETTTTPAPPVADTTTRTS